MSFQALRPKRLKKLWHKHQPEAEQCQGAAVDHRKGLETNEGAPNRGVEAKGI